MQLCIRLKINIIASAGKKDIALQKIGPNYIWIRLNDVHGFSDDDVKYIIKEIPEYRELQEAIKRYLNGLEGNKASTLAAIKSKFHRFTDVEVMDLKFKTETKLKHWISFTTDNVSEGYEYACDILEYSHTNNNVLYE